MPKSDGLKPLPDHVIAPLLRARRGSTRAASPGDQFVTCARYLDRVGGGRRWKSARCGGLLLPAPDVYLPLRKVRSQRGAAMNPTVPIMLAVSLCICSPALGAQIEWNDATCSYKLTFDARKFDRDALKGTIDILFNELPYVPTAPFFFDGGCRARRCRQAGAGMPRGDRTPEAPQASAIAGAGELQILPGR
jgi:hypothetical protein